MIRLLRAETHRALARRALWVVLACAVGLTCLIGVGIGMAAAPPSADAVEMGRTFYQQAHADWEAHHVESYSACIESTPESDRKQCDDINREPLATDFVPQPMLIMDALDASAMIGAVVGSLLALIGGATFWGAEYRHGTLATWLTFVPDRTRVWLAKSAVLVVWGALRTLVVEGVLMGIAAGSVVAWQGAAAASASPAAALGVAGRGLALGALASLVGGSLAVLFRQTVAPALLPLAYLFLQAFAGLLYLIPGGDALTEWLPEQNISAFLNFGTTYVVSVQQVTAQGTTMAGVERTLSFAHGATYILVAVALVALGSLLSFRRRDVA